MLNNIVPVSVPEGRHQSLTKKNREKVTDYMRTSNLIQYGYSKVTPSVWNLHQWASHINGKTSAAGSSLDSNT